MLDLGMLPKSKKLLRTHDKKQKLLVCQDS